MHEKRGNASKPKRTFSFRIILSVNVMTLATINNKHISTSQCQFFASRIKKSKKLSYVKSSVISIKFYLKLSFFWTWVLDTGQVIWPQNIWLKCFYIFSNRSPHETNFTASVNMKIHTWPIYTAAAILSEIVEINKSRK